MITGFNTDVKFRGLVYHVQTEDKGKVNPLIETLIYKGGEILASRRLPFWTLRRAPGDTTGSRWTGTADGVVGEAVGVVSGNALHWAYTFDLKTDDGARYRVAFDDWMYLIDDRLMLNRAVMRWYGIRAGEVLISFRKL